MSAPAQTAPWLRHPLLDALGAEHGFGLRSSPEPDRVVCPRQVHGSRVARLEPGAAGDLGEADAVVSRDPIRPVGVVTADCLPVLLASADATRVAAVHAGWRGLAAGVIDAATAALPGLAGAVIGPHIGPCCYEVDGPVLGPLRERFAADLDPALCPSRPGHARLDLGMLARVALERAGLAADRIGALSAACTRCDAERFHSYRRDGEASGRLLHWIVAAPPPPGVDTPGASP